MTDACTCADKSTVGDNGLESDLLILSENRKGVVGPTCRISSKNCKALTGIHTISPALSRALQRGKIGLVFDLPHPHEEQQNPLWHITHMHVLIKASR